MKILLALLIIFVINSANFAQVKVSGKVTDVVNGKTITIETPSKTKFIVELQSIEVPEPEQPLADVVKEHLKKLVLGKNVVLQMRGLPEGNQIIGRVLIGNLDLSEQMLRDGAAWYAILEKDSQDSRAREVYQATESAAKSEKRGVWGVAGLKPAWEFRAEKQIAKTTLSTKNAGLLQPLRQIQPAQINKSSGDANITKFKPKSLKSLLSAQEFFEECDQRGSNFDVSVADCYSDKAIIQNTRRYPDGQTRILQFPAVQYKKLIVDVMPLAKERNDYSTLSNVTYTAEGKKVRVNATRYSVHKKYYSPLSVLVGRDSSGSWRIFEEISESQP